MASLMAPGTSWDAGGPTTAARHVYIIDDDVQVRKSLHFLLSGSSITPWPFATAADFLEHLPDCNPAPILLDIRMPGISGLDMLAILKKRDVRWPVIMMTAHGDVPIAVRAMKLGAIEFLEKPFQPDLLDQVLDTAFDVVDRLVKSEQSRAQARRLLDLLSPRESEILGILSEGVANKEVANRLALSPRTVEMHRGNAMAKLGLKSIAEVIALVTAADRPFQTGKSHLDAP